MYVSKDAHPFQINCVYNPLSNYELVISEEKNPQLQGVYPLSLKNSMKNLAIIIEYKFHTAIKASTVSFVHSLLSSFIIYPSRQRGSTISMCHRVKKKTFYRPGRKIKSNFPSVNTVTFTSIFYFLHWDLTGAGIEVKVTNLSRVITVAYIKDQITNESFVAYEILSKLAFMSNLVL